MKGVVKNYRRGRHTVNERQLVIEIEGIHSRPKAFSMVGSRVQWKTKAGKPFNGKIVSAHGNNGAVRALFRKGLPGQCIGQKVEVMAREQHGKGKKAAQKPAPSEKPKKAAKTAKK